MELKELAIKRRSTRKYLKDVYISDDEIKELISFCYLSPSWKNSETARYIVCNKEESVKKVYACLPEFNQNNTLNVNCYIISCFKKDRAGFSKDGTPSDDLGNMWGAYDLGLQNQMLILKAKDMGYDSLIMGLSDRKRIRKEFSIPDDYEIMPIIALGKVDGEHLNLKRRELEEVLKIY